MYLVGSKIVFNKTLLAPANEDHPPIVYAYKNETGEIISYKAREGYLVKTDSWPASFGAYEYEFSLI